jgi:hypothetical protein
VRLQFYKHPFRFSATRPGCEPLPGQSTLQRLKVPTRTNGSVLGQTIPPSAPRRAISKCDCLVGRLSFRMRLFPSPDPRQNPLDFSMQSSTPRFRRSQSRTLAIPSPRYTRYSGNPIFYTAPHPRITTRLLFTSGTASLISYWFIQFAKVPTSRSSRQSPPFPTRLQPTPAASRHISHIPLLSRINRQDGQGDEILRSSRRMHTQFERLSYRATVLTFCDRSRRMPQSRS